VQKLADALRSNLDAFYQQAAGRMPELVLTEEEQQAAARAPAWKASLLDILTEKIKLPQAGSDMHWHYIFEINNLIDGRRSILDIYRIVRAAALSAGDWYYGPVEFGVVKQHIERMEKSGAITLQGK
jgi:hypothetical protein